MTTVMCRVFSLADLSVAEVVEEVRWILPGLKDCRVEFLDS